jgi:hypothetical protein
MTFTHRFLKVRPRVALLSEPLVPEVDIEPLRSLQDHLIVEDSVPACSFA